MEWLIIAGSAVVGTLLVSLVYFFVVGPNEKTEGAEEARREAQAHAEGLKRGAEAVEEWKKREQAKVDEKLAADKKRQAVDVANELLQEFRKNKS